MISNAHQFHMVALFLTGFSSIQRCDSRAYKVTDSHEEHPPDFSADYSRGVTGDDESHGSDANGFHFPDFFNNGRADGEPVSFNVVSPFESSFASPLESRSGDSTQYVVPAGTHRTNDDVIPHYRSPSYHKSEYHEQKKPITTLFDDWTPDDEKPRSAKWSQEHVDEDSVEEDSPDLPPVSKPRPATHLRGEVPGRRPYSHAIVKQHYKPAKQIGGPRGLSNHYNDGGESIHQHKYGVSHQHDPKKSVDNGPDYDYNDNLRSTKPQQFVNPRRKNSPSKARASSSSSPKSWGSFKPSPPDHFLNTKDGNFDHYFGDSSKFAIKQVKAAPPKDQLDPSCVKKKKSTVLKLSDTQLIMQCYQCYDKKLRRQYEQCIEVPKSQSRHKRQISNAPEQTSVQRGKRQEEDYYVPEHYHQDSSDYRFGPEHFNSDYPSSHDDANEGTERESERCHKSRKGEMVCITCENSMNGGTYQQCSYASDPKKNSYETSISKTYGSPRHSQENRRKLSDLNGPRQHQSYRKPTTSAAERPSGLSAYANPGRYRVEPAGKKNVIPPRGNVGSRYKGSQSRSPAPVQSEPRRKPARKAALTPSLDPERPLRPRGKPSQRQFRSSGKPLYYSQAPPPAANRAYSTPPPVGPNPYLDDIPDPYSPTNPISPFEESDYDGGRSNLRTRKNVDASYEPGYDETFASLFPELADTDPVILAPPSYDEYPDGDYEDLPERRKDVQVQTLAQDTPKVYPMSRLPTYSDDAPEYRPEDAPSGKRSVPSDSSVRKENKTCKKVKKNKMTCIQCIDEKGSKQEDCSYVRGTDPKTKQIAYREVKETNYSPTDAPDSSKRNAPQLKQVDTNGRGKRKFKKYDSDEANSDELWQRPANRNQGGENSENYDERRHFLPSRSETRGKRENSDVDTAGAEEEKTTRKDYNPVPSDPPVLTDSERKLSENGEFSGDTEPKYDPLLGISLPKYMLEKSEHEAIFDEVLASGKR